MEELKHFNMKLVENDGRTVYNLEETGCMIIEHKSLVGEYYPLSTKEVLNVLDRYNVLKDLKSIEIFNTSLVNSQARAQVDKTAVTFYVNSNLIFTDPRVKGFPERKAALWGVLHEIGHLLDPNVHLKMSAEYYHTKAEPVADKFACEEVEKLWGKLIKE